MNTKLAMQTQINAIKQVCIQLIKSDIKYIYKVIKYFYLKYILFFWTFHQRILKMFYHSFRKNTKNCFRHLVS